MVAWGAGPEYDFRGNLKSDYGGDCSKVQHQLVDVQSIYSTTSAFAALKADGSVVAWGSPGSGGDCSEVQAQLTADVQSIYSTSAVPPAGVWDILCDGYWTSTYLTVALFTPSPTGAPAWAERWAPGGRGTGSRRQGCGEGEGDCDSNSECASGLSCFQRSGFTVVPGCSGSGVKSWDYCVAGSEIWCWYRLSYVTNSHKSF